jgi:hypothetical protein
MSNSVSRSLDEKESASACAYQVGVRDEARGCRLQPAQNTAGADKVHIEGLWALE